VFTARYTLSPYIKQIRFVFKGLKSSSSCIRLLPRLPVTSLPPSILPSITRFTRQFLSKMWPIQLAFLLFIAQYSYPPWLFVILPYFSYERSNWSSPSFSNARFQNFPRISDLLSEVSKFQHHIKLCSKCSTSLACSLHLKRCNIREELSLQQHHLENHKSRTTR
jgi:hypothetical protein